MMEHELNTKKRKSEVGPETVELYTLNDTLLKENSFLKKQLHTQGIELHEMQKLKSEIETLKLERQILEDHNKILIQEKVSSNNDSERFRLLFPNVKILDVKHRLDNFEKQNELLRIKIETMTPKEYNEPSDLQELKNDISEKDKMIESLKEENINIRAEMDRRFGVGEFNSKTTKVIHLIQNPSHRGKQGSEEDRREILALKEEIEEMKKSDSQIKIIDLELSMNRLKQQFKSKIQDFRMVVYLLFGYKMDAMEGGMYKFSSTYAENERDWILVQYQDKKINLLESEYCSGLEKGITDYLTKFHSFPAFTAQLTMNLFNKTTNAQ